MIQKSTTFTTIFRIKKYYFHYDFACKKVLLSLRYAKNNFFNSSYNYWHWTYCSNGLQCEQMNYYSASTDARLSKKPQLRNWFRSCFCACFFSLVFLLTIERFSLTPIASLPLSSIRYSLIIIRHLSPAADVTCICGVSVNQVFYRIRSF
jgi:hypothetical protein